MTAIKGTKARLLVDEFNFSGQTSGFEVQTGVSEADSTNLESDALEFEPLLPMMILSQNGYLYGSNAGSFEDELWDRLGVEGVIAAVLFGIDDPDCPAYVLEDTYGAEMSIQAPTSGLITIAGAWGKSSGGHRGIRIFTGTLDATGAQTAYDLGAAGSEGGEAYLFVQGITGSASGAEVLVESSETEGGTYATEATFTFSAVGSIREDLSGTVNRWVRLNLDDLGGADDITFVLIVCVDGVTQ